MIKQGNIYLIETYLNNIDIIFDFDQYTQIYLDCNPYQPLLYLDKYQNEINTLDPRNF
jgi:hypothetical protein